MADRTVPVSVIVPARDCGEYLGEALSSLAAQTVRPEEVLVVDDGSTDNTPAVLASEIAKHPDVRIRAIHHARPAGFAASLAEAIEATNAPLIAHVDADDRVLPHYLEHLVEALDANPRAAYAYPRMRLFGTESGIYMSGRFSPARLLYDGNYIPHIGIMRRSAYLRTVGYRDLPTHVDWDLWLSLLDRGLKGVFVDEVLYEWRRHHASMTIQPTATRLVTRIDIVKRHPRLLLRYLPTGMGYLAWSLWRRVRVRIPFGNARYARTASCWIETNSR